MILSHLQFPPCALLRGNCHHPSSSAPHPSVSLRTLIKACMCVSAYVNLCARVCVHVMSLCSCVYVCVYMSICSYYMIECVCLCVCVSANGWDPH